jgi:hypothetical protein
MIDVGNLRGTIVSQVSTWDVVVVVARGRKKMALVTPSAEERQIINGANYQWGLMLDAVERADGASPLNNVKAEGGQ